MPGLAPGIHRFKELKVTPMNPDAAHLARRLADNAEAVCQQYLSNGRREGASWRVGDVRNTPGRSMFVRLKASRGRSAGKWADAATGEHGDLLDVIRETCGLASFRDVVEEARRFLALPEAHAPRTPERQRVSRNSPEAARRLFAGSRPLVGTLGEAHLRGRCLVLPPGSTPLRFHPRCYYRPDDESPSESHPAIIAAVTDDNGAVTGVHRTWLRRGANAPEVLDRRALGNLLGHGVRFGVADDVLIAGEGIETVLSLACVMPAMSLVAALSAGHLGVFAWPGSLRRLYVARDQDGGGDSAFERLHMRTDEAGIELIGLTPTRNDFNDDLRDFGADHLRRLLSAQLVPADRARFLAG